MRKTTYHCHSIWSDGKNTVREMVLEAINLGFTDIGFADHLALHPTKPGEDWSLLDESEVKDYYKDVQTEQIRKKNSIKIKIGVEVDFFPENPRNNELEDILGIVDFDFVIGSVHMLGELPVDYMQQKWMKLSQKTVNESFIEYWRNIKLLAESNYFDCVGHLDIIKFFNFQPNIDLTKYIEDAIWAISSAGMAVEINTAGLDKPCKELYPSPELMELVVAANIPVIINDDAHAVEHLGRHYEKAEELLKNSGAQQIFELPIG